jgi:hypothetical protein
MIRDIIITPVLNGFKVHVGCQEVVFTSAEKLCLELGRYLADPDTVEKEYFEKSINAKHLNPQPPGEIRRVPNDCERTAQGCEGQGEAPQDRTAGPAAGLGRLVGR